MMVLNLEPTTLKLPPARCPDTALAIAGFSATQRILTIPQTDEKVEGLYCVVYQIDNVRQHFQSGFGVRLNHCSRIQVGV